MENKLSIDEIRKQLSPLAEAAVSLVDRLYARDSCPMLRIQRARLVLATHHGTPVQFMTACLTCIGTLRGLCRAENLSAPPPELENEIRELMRIYNTAHILVTTSTRVSF